MIVNYICFYGIVPTNDSIITELQAVSVNRMRGIVFVFVCLPVNDCLAQCILGLTSNPCHPERDYMGSG